MTAGGWDAPSAAASYVENARGMVPWLAAVHDLVDLLLAETVPADGRVLVVGAGGGLELRHLAERHDGWTFDGVDPSAPMLRLAGETMGTLSRRASLIEGTAADAPAGPFDGATCLLTLHFLPAAERLETLREIRRRLRPGAPLLTFQHSVPGDPGTAATWLRRFARNAAGPAADEERIATTADALATRLPFLRPEEDEALLRTAGFGDVGLFFAALTFRGWVAYA